MKIKDNRWDQSSNCISQRPPRSLWSRSAKIWLSRRKTY